MSLYATTVIPSFDGVSGVNTLQRLLNDSTLVAHAIYDAETQSTVAILKTDGTELCLERAAEALKRFDVPLIKSHSLLDAISRAKKLAHDRDLVEITDYHLEDTFSF